MRCDDCQALISDYIDGELELGEQTQVEHHLSACTPCRVMRDDLLLIINSSRRLPEETPSNSIWLDICSEIEMTRPNSGLRNLWARVSGWEFRLSGPQLAIASISIVVATAAIIGLSQWRDAIVAPSTFGNQATTVKASGSNDVEDIEQRIGQLQAQVEERREEWQPQVRSSFDRNMLYIDQSLAECRQRLRANPYDDLSQELMLNAYREKVRLLEGFSDY